MSLGGLISVVALFYFYTTSYYFRFNIVALYMDRFVEGGYTIFSAKHLVDYCNLLIMLAPSLTVLAVMFLTVPFKVLKARADNLHLVILCLSTLGAIFLFDPDLGMPRDWDMLSFAFVPLVLATFYSVLNGVDKTGLGRAGCFLAVILNILVLGPRVVGQVDAEISLEHFTSYVKLDRERALQASAMIANYHLERGDTASSNEARRWWNETYQERGLLRRAEVARDEGRISDSFALAKEALRWNCANYHAYASLAYSFFAVRMYDSAEAYMEISNGMMPRNPSILYSLGHLRYLEGNHREAEKLWKMSIYYDTTNSEPFLGLATLAKSRGDLKEYQRCMEGAVTTEDVTGATVKQLADLHYSQGRKDAALRYYKLALDKGLPQKTADELLLTFPQLAPDSL